MICSDSIYTAIESKKDNPGNYLTLVKKIKGSAAVVKFQKTIKHEIAPLVSHLRSKMLCTL